MFIPSFLATIISVNRPFVNMKPVPKKKYPDINAGEAFRYFFLYILLGILYDGLRTQGTARIENLRQGDIIMLQDYFIQNWALILILPAFVISLKTTIFLDKTSVKRYYALITGIFLLSVVVFLEFALADLGGYITQRKILMTIRYSAGPFIVAMILFTLIKGIRWIVFIPAILLTGINLLSIFTGIVFSLDENGTLHRGPLGLLPYIIAGLYGANLIFVLFKRSNKLYTEIVPITYLAIAFASVLFLPFVFGRKFSQMFCITIAIALFVFYEFSIHQITKKDSLTGVLNRQAYYTDREINPERITGLVTLDMNGLKEINDNQGHVAGDEALATLARCLLREKKVGQSVYRIGGDEFVIICRDASPKDVVSLMDRIKKSVDETEYSCSLGYCCSEGGSNDIDDMLRKADEMMYAEKARYYKTSGKDRRQRSQDRL